ncbi:MAG: Zn-dependent hydrolase, partial [Acidimicrobiia bacterium]|nr:Zn-dependent hydrolase [Acidimicrobiia bacterium]
MPLTRPDLAIDIDRLLGRLADLAAVGAIEGTEGCARLALTDEDRAGRDLVVSQMRDLGLDVSIDGIGNVVAVMKGRDEGPPVMTGSHIDTVRTGGRYDGNLGVLAGLEVIEVLKSAGVTP